MSKVKYIGHISYLFAKYQTETSSENNQLKIHTN
jgi:hypothetical protein